MILTRSAYAVQGTRLYRDPFGENMLSSAFDNNKQLAQSIQLELPKLEGPLWWMSRDMDGTHVVHATLTEPSTALTSSIHGCIHSLQQQRVFAAHPAKPGHCAILPPLAGV